MDIAWLDRSMAEVADTWRARLNQVELQVPPAGQHLVNTLRSWGVNVDETYFLGGVDKAEVLKASVTSESAAMLEPSRSIVAGPVSAIAPLSASKLAPEPV